MSKTLEEIKAIPIPEPMCEHGCIYQHQPKCPHFVSIEEQHQKYLAEQKEKKEKSKPFITGYIHTSSN